MTFDDYCKATGHYAEAGDRAMWEAATKAEREACHQACRELAKRMKTADERDAANSCAEVIYMRSNA